MAPIQKRPLSCQLPYPALPSACLVGKQSLMTGAQDKSVSKTYRTKSPEKGLRNLENKSLRPKQ